MAIAAKIPSDNTWSPVHFTPDDAAKLLLRVVLGVLMVLHDIGKLNGGIAGRISVGGAQGRWN